MEMGQELLNKLAILGAGAFVIVAILALGVSVLGVVSGIRKRIDDRRRTVWMEIKLVNADSAFFSVSPEAASLLFEDYQKGGRKLECLRDRHGTIEQYGRTIFKVEFTDRKTGGPITFDNGKIILTDTPGG